MVKAAIDKPQTIGCSCVSIKLYVQIKPTGDLDLLTHTLLLEVINVFDSIY
jgi:hypothetical protein